VAVIISAADIGEVLREMPGALDELARACGATEFHFADIYNGRRQFKDLDLNLRLAFFRLMSHIFQLYKFPIIVQTFDPLTLQDVHRRANLPVKRIGPFNLEKQEDLALFFLLLRVKLYLEKNCPGGRQARVFVDEGFKRNGAAIRMPRFAGQFVDGLVCFARSDTILPIQLADFAAFALNRHQILLSKPELSDLDRELLAILTPMTWNYQNIQQIRLPLRARHAGRSAAASNSTRTVLAHDRKGTGARLPAPRKWRHMACAPVGSYGRLCRAQNRHHGRFAGR
jgi:hypothetical protein